MTSATSGADPPLTEFLARQPQLAPAAALPEVNDGGKAPSLLSILKGVIGKDLSNPIPVPMQLAEPASDLVKRAEDMAYSELLDKAAAEPKGSLARLLHVTGYALSPYAAAHADRVGMPLFSAPGETLEAILPEKGVRFIAETIFDDGWHIAYHAEGRGWKLASDDQMRFNIYPNSMVATPNWFLELTFDDGDIYTWQKVLTTAHNIMTGTKFVAHTGKLTILQHSSEASAVLAFSTIPALCITTKARKQANRQIQGQVLQCGKPLDVKLSGFWDSHLDVAYEDGTVVRLWTAQDMLITSNRWTLPAFALRLKELPEDLKHYLPSTDTRFRQDIAFMERGKWDQAQEEKEKLEGDCFKNVAAARKSGTLSIKSHWFLKPQQNLKIKAGAGIRWRYSGRYWASREALFQGEMLPQMFGKDLPLE